jgi:Phage capsid family
MRAADSTGGTVSFPDVDRVGPFYGVLPQLRRRLRLLDLIPTQVMSQGSSFHYTQELGSFDTAVETAELAAKSPADVDYEDAEAVAVTIAHWFKASRQSLADVPQLVASLNSRLMYGVFRRLEGQILAGDGTGQNLRGILNTTGIASVAYVAGDPLTDLTLDAITDVIISDAQPDAVVANPVDVAAMLKAKAAGSGERLDSDGAFRYASDADVGPAADPERWSRRGLRWSETGRRAPLCGSAKACSCARATATRTISSKTESRCSARVGSRSRSSGPSCFAEVHLA